VKRTGHRIVYRGFGFWVIPRPEGWFHLDVGVDLNDASADDCNGPFEDKSDAISDGAERIDLSLS
jgi:hypothetical protein